MKTFKIYTSGNMLKIDYSVDAVLVKTYTAFRGTSTSSAFATSEGSNVYLHNIHSADSVIRSAIDFDAVDVEFLNSSDVAYATIADLLAGIDSLSGNFNSGGGSPQLTANELLGIQNANELNESNPVATINNTLDFYSENETFIGYWIDGKPIYQRTFIINNETELAHYFEVYVDVLVKAFGSIKQGSVSRTFPQIIADVLCDAETDDGNLTIYTQSDVNAPYEALFNVTVQYTKTTD